MQNMRREMELSSGRSYPYFSEYLYKESVMCSAEWKQKVQCRMKSATKKKKKNYVGFWAIMR